MESKSKTFLGALDNLSKEPDKLKKVLADKRINSAEKKILEGYLLLRDSRFDEIIASLSVLHVEDPAVEDHRLQVLSGAFNNKSESQKAWMYLEKARSLRKEFKIQRGQFKFLVHCFFVSLNLQKLDSLKEIYAEMTKWYEETENQFIDFTTCQYYMSQLDQNFKKSKSLLQTLKSRMNQMSEIQIINYYIFEYNFYLSLNEFEGSSRALEEMKSFRKFRLGADYKFMRTLLDHCYHNKPIYLYDQDFAEYPELLNQVKVIKCLEQKDKISAVQYWQKLHALSPVTYQDGFVFQGLTCIFSKCLDKHFASEVHVDETSVINGDENKEDKVVSLLTLSQAGLAKDKMYKLVYGCEPSDKDDFNKLKTLISAIRKKRAINIKSRKGCYFIAS